MPVPPNDHVSGLAETRLAHAALRRVCSVVLREEGCSSVAEHPDSREVEGSIPFDSTNDKLTW
jgi:hypothetical protein